MDDVGMDDVAEVGGKNASLGEMLQALKPQGVRIPSGFIVTASAYRSYLKKTELDEFIKKTLTGLNTRDIGNLARRGKLIRERMRRTPLPVELSREIAQAYRTMEERYGRNADVAVRSSATAEDLPGASFAGEHETYLGIRGERAVEEAVVWAMASLFTNRAISYRKDKGFAHLDVALSVGVQKMVRSDKGAAGVMFTLDTETGFKDIVLINAVWGLGEMIVQGRVTPDEYLVRKSGIDNAKLPIVNKVPGIKNAKMIYAPKRRGTQGGLNTTKVVGTSQQEKTSFILSNKEIMTLAKWGALIEEHYTKRAGRWMPMDMEWAKDGETGELHIVQARPETVHASRDFNTLKEYNVTKHGPEAIRGISVGSAVVVGPARVIIDPKQIEQFKKGEILVTTMTDPDWEPVMKNAAAIITDRGGRTSHAAIVARELGVPAIVGTGNATRVLKTGDMITVDSTESDGRVYRGKASFVVKIHNTASLPKTKTSVMVNVATPGMAFAHSFLPVSGVGLAREEFIIASEIGIHPLALIDFNRLKPALKTAIKKKMIGWEDPVTFYVDRLAYGIAIIGTAFYPRPVIVRFSDFKTNEYRSLLGGALYEPVEENPMIGWRGASRYYDPKFERAFRLECEALTKVRTEMGLTNVIPMVPFCRTLSEADHVLDHMAAYGLTPRSRAGQQKSGDANTATPVYVMCEIPSNALSADAFLDRFDGMSIGSNDLTQLTLGLDRDSSLVAGIGNENDPAVRDLIDMVIAKCRARGKYLGICGQGPSDLPDFAAFLVESGIESMSLNPDRVVPTIAHIAKVESASVKEK